MDEKKKKKKKKCANSDASLSLMPSFFLRERDACRVLSLSLSRQVLGELVVGCAFFVPHARALSLSSLFFCRIFFPRRELPFTELPKP